MKVKAVILAICVVIGLLAASCGASKTCPAYGKASVEQQGAERS